MKKRDRKTVLVFGVFDLLHPGHVAFLRAAARHGAVTAVVTRDAKVLREKGRRPAFSERERLAMVAALKHVERAVLGDKWARWSVVERLAPDVICVGHDQDARHPKFLAQASRLPMRPKIVRIAGHRPRKYSSTRLKLEIHRSAKTG
ncbi:MAG TPA: adenylyltransferase/cytidyltransferase family protein [Patescibacteria group bacterium]|nr:adenylyltransferase/cytidyltransferase family protein [Patescibacteria group bacterium]